MHLRKPQRLQRVPLQGAAHRQRYMPRNFPLLQIRCAAKALAARRHPNRPRSDWVPRSKYVGGERPNNQRDGPVVGYWQFEVLSNASFAFTSNNYYGDDRGNILTI